MPDERPNVLFLISDQHSPWSMSHRDEPVDEPVRTPALDSLAERGTNFRSAYSQFPICTPSRLCLLTGREPHRCDAWGNGHMLHDEYTTIADAFSDDGYETAHIGKMHFEGDNQFAGFDQRPYGDVVGGMGHQPDPPTPYFEKDWTGLFDDADVTGLPESMLQEANVSRESLGFVREQQDQDQPWFLMASFSRPHWPFTAPRRHFERYWDEDGPTDEMMPPEISPESDAAQHPFIQEAVGTTDLDNWPEGEMLNRAGYFAAMDYLDEIIGDLLASLERQGALENTIVVYTSDHGEMAGEHGRGGKLIWHEASAGVPLLIQTPDQRAGDETSHTVETPVSLGDLFPTLASMCDVPAPDGLDGEDITEAVRDGVEIDRGPVFSDNFSPYNWGEGSEFRMVRDGKWKYVQHRGYREALFDIEDDPREEHDLAPGATGEAAEALERLRAIVDESVDWEAFDEQRQQSKEVVRERNLGLEVGSGNQYHLPDGRIVDADTPLYQPHTLARDPEQLIGDYPGHDSPGHTW